MAKRRAKGEGSIYFNKNDGRWKAQITLPNGERKGKSAKTQKEVRDWLIQQRSKVNEGLFVNSQQLKLGDFLDRYMQDVAIHHLRPRTFERYSDLIRIHIRPWLGNIRLNELRPDQVQSLYNQKINEGLSKSTVQYIHAVLHKSLNQGLKWGLVSRNVTDLVDKPRPAKKTFKTWTPHDINRFLAAVEDHRWYLIYVIAIYCGLRQGEVLGLHREDIDLEKGVIHVRHQVSTVRGRGLVITEPKTDKARRPVTVPPSALKVLKAHLKGPGLVFATTTGKPISPRNLLRHFKQVIANEGLPEIRFHDLRHTHATLLLAAGVHPKVVQERLGHSQISLTLDTYSHVIPSLQDEAADQFDKIVA